MGFAKANIGKAYVFDTAGPDTFDCSGLTLAAYKLVGVDLPHSSFLQAQMGNAVPIDPSQVQPGDLIFTKDSEGQVNGHVAIAENSSTWISAPHTGATVHEAPIPWQSVTAIRRFIS